MRWSFKIARVAGIDVFIHFTFLLLLAFYAWLFYQDGGVTAAVYGVGLVLTIFLCVLLHEFGHAFAARAYGIRTPDITLLPIGGVARLERMPRSPVQELVIAIAGPLVNVGIILVLMVLLVGKTDWGTLESVGIPAGSFLGKILWINVMLVAFNAIPAFPMDGGRVFRALLAMFIDHSKATMIAARAGQVIAVGFGILGFMGNPILLLIAMFVFMGAQQELAYAQMRSRVDGMRVGDVMVTQFATIPDTVRIGQITDVLVRSGQEIFPMVDGLMHFRGLATREDLARAVRELPPESPASCVARTIPTVTPTGSVAEAIELLQRLDEPVLPVTNASGQLVGLFAVSRQQS